MYKMGQKPEGIYLIKEGAFEISKPANIGHLNKKNLQNANIDPIAKIQLKKQSQVLQDKAMNNIRVAILGNGECFGIEEC
jgi:hypothetical protein